MQLKYKLGLLATALLLASCGGGDAGDQSPRVKFSSLVSFGDSLSDVGTHNVGTIAALGAATGGAGRWTINSAAGGEIWTERLAVLLGVAKPCAAETGLLPNLPGTTGAAPTAKSGCFSYAQGSARVESPAGPFSYALQLAFPGTAVGTNIGLLAKPVKDQMAAHLTAASGNYSGNELVIVMAGANDVFMELETFKALAPVLGATAAATQVVTNVAAAGTALGQLIKTQVIAKGAKRVLVMNIPDIAGSVFGQAQLDASGKALADSMVKGFNAALAAQLANVPEVRLGDAYAISKDQIANPASYGLDSVTAVACGTNALGGSSLVCNTSNTVAGSSRYLFADSVHPTPYGHQLLSQFAASELAKAGWL